MTKSPELVREYARCYRFPSSRKKNPIQHRCETQPQSQAKCQGSRDIGLGGGVGGDTGHVHGTEIIGPQAGRYASLFQLLEQTLVEGVRLVSTSRFSKLVLDRAFVQVVGVTLLLFQGIVQHASRSCAAAWNSPRTRSTTFFQFNLNLRLYLGELAVELSYLGIRWAKLSTQHRDLDPGLGLLCLLASRGVEHGPRSRRFHRFRGFLLLKPPVRIGDWTSRYSDSFSMRSDSAIVSSRFNSSSFAVIMFCFSSVPRIPCSFWTEPVFPGMTPPSSGGRPAVSITSPRSAWWTRISS